MPSDNVDCKYLLTVTRSGRVCRYLCQISKKQIELSECEGCAQKEPKRTVARMIRCTKQKQTNQGPVCVHRRSQFYHQLVNQECCANCPLLKAPTSVKFVKYASSTLDWVKAGCPERTPEEIEAIYKICETCDAFNQTDKVCRLCGCHTNRTKSGWLNKISRTTEHCVRKLW